VERLERLAVGEVGLSRESNAQRAAALDGEAARELRKAIALDVRREIGSFFSSGRLARKAVSLHPLPSQGVLYDPACGGGDLLLAAARRLPVRTTLRATLTLWSSRLGGRDVYPEFVRATKARLVLLARKRTRDRAPLSGAELDRALSKITTGSGFEKIEMLGYVSWVVMNPPFGLVDAPYDCTWSKGKVNAAAVFFERLLVCSSTGTRLTAILPEVLRTGSRYRAWRKAVSLRLKLESLERYGVFDSAADVHVFLLHGTVVRKRPSSRISWWKPTVGRRQRLSDLFDVNVGPVVPHRHKKRGPICLYVHAKKLPPWERSFTPIETRRFKGTLYEPPFIAIRRTSRPEDEYRAVAVIISGKQLVAVENHLIICRPKNGSLGACLELLKRLKSRACNAFLNERIRCRHLTVASIRDIPLSART